ncbi:MAG: DUF2939 domain-containing protein [Xanthomonadaceae bacterium]|jgi:hypothetical protein|nr:DUF2939 domain-containing protein [Xanthomonadaceae bacterium]
MSKRIKLSSFLLLAVLAAVLGYVVAGPYLAIGGIQRALAEENTGKLQAYVDFPRLRGNLKHQLNDYLIQQTGIDAESGLFGLIASSAVDNVTSIGVDAMMSPAGIAAMLQGRSAWRYFIAKLPEHSVSGRNDGQDSIRSTRLLDNAEHRFESFSRFTATIRHTDGSSTAFIFERQGLRWKLIDIRVPLWTAADVSRVDNSSALGSIPSLQIDSDPVSGIAYPPRHAINPLPMMTAVSGNSCFSFHIPVRSFP